MFSIKFKTSIFKGQTDYVAGFSSQHSCVQRTTGPQSAKQFKSKATTQKFIDKYSGAGYGLEKDMVEIV